MNLQHLIRWVLADVSEHLDQPESAIEQLEVLLQLSAWITYSPAQFKLGQLYTQMAVTTEALEHYAAFLDAFTDPDPEYEWMVDQARAEVERLGRGR